METSDMSQRVQAAELSTWWVGGTVGLCGAEALGPIWDSL